MKKPAVYIMANKRNGTIYIGVTSDLIRRVYLHRNNLSPGFAQKYQTRLLVYYQSCPSMEAAIHREKQLKDWKRSWKINLIESSNPYWLDLYQDLFPAQL
jgi:putative endonuclease